jgi:hypothetical protein
MSGCMPQLLPTPLRRLQENHYFRHVFQFYNYYYAKRRDFRVETSDVIGF